MNDTTKTKGPSLITDDVLKELARKLLTGMPICTNAENQNEEIDRASVYDQVTDNPAEAEFLYLAAHWDNDVLDWAASIGIKFVMTDADGDEIDLEDMASARFMDWTTSTASVRDMTPEEIVEYKLQQTALEAELAAEGLFDLEGDA